MTRDDLSGRPHLVMVVNNSIVGDSRVVKSAQSGLDAGYRVTVVGIRSRSTTPFDQDRDALIYRAEMNPRHLLAHDLTNELKLKETVSVIEPLPGEKPVSYFQLRDRDGRGRMTKRFRALRPVTGAASELSRRITMRSSDTFNSAKYAVKRVTSPLPGQWRRMWPHAVDHEELFLEALLELKPDLIHCHDYHPMPGVAAYASLMQRRGKSVPWVYDAHEWAPGQVSNGRKEAHDGWVAAEAELIQRADAVISVSDELALRMKRRHALPKLPTVVTNAPVSMFVPMSPEERLPLREECGLDEDTPLLVYVGKLGETRGVFTLIESLVHLPEAHVAFVGSNTVKVIAEMRELAERLGVTERMHILSYVPADSVTWYVASASIGVSPLLPTPAHNAALPTKIREYIHSKLPMVVSGLRAQGSFIKAEGVGETFEPGDAKSLAEAVSRVLNNYSEFKARFTPEFLEKHTWEGNAVKLTELWNALTPPTTLATPRTISTEVVKAPLSVEPTQSTLKVAIPAESHDQKALADACLAEFGVVVKLDPVIPPTLESAAHRWNSVVTNANVVLLPGSGSLVGDYYKLGVQHQIETLRQNGLGVGVTFGDGPLLNTDELQASFPGHPAEDWPSAMMRKHNRSVRTTAKLISQLRVATFSSLVRVSVATDYATWLPHVVRVSPTPSPRPQEHSDLRIMLLPAARTSDEVEAVDKLERMLRERGISLERPRGRGFNPAVAGTADIVIASLSFADTTSDVCVALGAGRVVIADSGLTDFGVPVFGADSASLLTRMDELLTMNEEKYGAIQVTGLDYAHRIFSGEATLSVLNDTFASKRPAW